MKNNIDEDIEKYFDVKKIPLQDIIRLFKREGIENFVIARRTKFENVLSELETYKKIAEKLADRVVMSKIVYPTSTLNNEITRVQMTNEEIIDWARNEVEK